MIKQYICFTILISTYIKMTMSDNNSSNTDNEELRKDIEKLRSDFYKLLNDKKSMGLLSC